MGRKPARAVVVAPWVRRRVGLCAPVQLGVSTTRAVCRGTVPQPGDLLFSPLSPATPAARWGRPCSVGKLRDSPHTQSGIPMAEGHLALSGMPCVSRMAGKGSPGQCGAGGGQDGKDWEGLWQPFMAWAQFTS